MDPVDMKTRDSRVRVKADVKIEIEKDPNQNVEKKNDRIFSDDCDLKSTNPQIQQQCLDNCISFNNYTPEHPNFQITIDFKYVMQEKQQYAGEKQENVRESEPLLIILKNSRFNKLLSHPVIRCYLCLKWHKVKIFFYLNLMWYFIYWFLLNSHLFCISHQASFGKYNTDDFHGAITSSLDNVCELPVSSRWKILIIISCSTLIFRELNQVWNLPMTYLKCKENWMELGLFGSTFYFVCVEHKGPILASAMVLVSWLELVLLIGRHPLLSTHIQMFKTVTENFFKYLFLYSIMIIAFAFSFYILFKDAKTTKDQPRNFQFITSSIFKTFLMSMNGFDTSTITSTECTIWAQIYALIFTFIISIVLLNLLNGLAFGDTLKIQDASELIGITSRINFIAQVESMTMLPFFKFIDKVCHWFCRCFSCSGKQNSASLFTETIHKHICLRYHLQDGKHKILPNCSESVAQSGCDLKIIEDVVNIMNNQ